jgi:serine protease
MNRHPRAISHVQVVVAVVLVVTLTGLAACTTGRPAPRTPAALATSPPATLIPTSPPSPALPQFSSAPANTIGDKPTIVPGQLIVKLQTQPAQQALNAGPQANGIISTGIAGIDQLNQQYGVTGFAPLVQPVAQASGETARAFGERQPALLGLYVVTFNPDYDAADVASAYAANPDVIYAEPNFYAYKNDGPPAPLAFTPDDPYFGFQWNFPQIQVPQAWDVSTGQGALIAELDTGIAYEDFDIYRQAPDLSSTHFLPGYDFINKDGHANDDEGHGTHVAGTLAQSTNNGVGVAGVAFNATLMPVKVLDSQGQGSYDVIAQGIIYAADRGARIISMSLSGRDASSALADAVSYAAQKGVLLVAAAGNSRGAVEYPAAYDQVLAVGSVGYDKVRVAYSDFGPQIELVAPGGDTNVDLNGDGYPDGILQQTFRGDVTNFSYYFYEGTSMAAPHVAAVAALLFAFDPAASARRVREVMESSALDLGPAGRDNDYGYGLVQAADALVALGGTPITPTPTATFTPTATPTPTSPGPSPTPTYTPTPTPSLTPPPVSGNLIVNGGFEDSEGWVFSRTRYSAGYSTQIVHSGARSARLGIVEGRDVYSYSSIWQAVAIPADTRRATLTYWVYPISQDVYPRDTQMVLLLNRRFRIIKYVEQTLSDAQQWIERSYDMTPYAGQTVLVYFGVFNGGRNGRTSAMYVDDVSLTVER